METEQTLTAESQELGDAMTDWRDSLSDDMKGSATLETFEDVNSLAKAYIDTKAMVGANTVKIPGKNATDDQLSEFYTALGRPETHDKYELPTENMPENFQPHEARLGAMQQAAFEAGLTSQQFAALVRADAKMMAELQGGMAEQNEQSAKEAMEAIKKEFGDAYHEKDALVQSFLQQFGGEGIADIIAQSGLFANLDFVKMMVRASEKLADDEVIGSGKSRSFTLSPADAKAQIDAKELDPEFMRAYLTMDAADPQTHCGGTRDDQNCGRLPTPLDSRNLYAYSVLSDYQKWPD